MDEKLDPRDKNTENWVDSSLKRKGTNIQWKSDEAF